MKTNVEGNPAITNFALEQNQFLANRYPERISFEYDGIAYRNFETAYQSQKMEKKLIAAKPPACIPKKQKFLPEAECCARIGKLHWLKMHRVRVSCANV